MPRSAYFISQGSEEILHRFAVVFPEFSEVFLERLVQSRPPVLTKHVRGVGLKCDEVLLPGFPTHDLEPIGSVL